MDLYCTIVRAPDEDSTVVEFTLQLEGVVYGNSIGNDTKYDCIDGDHRVIKNKINWSKVFYKEETSALYERK